jgi:hypothetical protein
MQKNEIRLCLSPYTKKNPKWIKDLNIRAETTKLIEQNSGNTSGNCSRQRFLEMTSKVQATKVKN